MTRDRLGSVPLAKSFVVKYGSEITERPDLDDLTTLAGFVFQLGRAPAAGDATSDQGWGG